MTPPAAAIAGATTPARIRSMVLSPNRASSRLSAADTVGAVSSTLWRVVLAASRMLHGGRRTSNPASAPHPLRPPSARRSAGTGTASTAAVVPVAALALSIGWSGAVSANPAVLDRVTEIEPFVARMEMQHGVSADETRALLADAVVLDSVLEAIQRPAERKPWHQYRRIFVTEQRIARGVEFWRGHSAALERASERFGVPPEIVVAIIGVESFYGVHLGRTRVLDALATLGFRYPRRSKFFLSELEEFVLLSREERLDSRRVNGSYAGAMGIAQFISSSYRHYAIDFDGDGSRDLMQSPQDAIGSIANYLSVHGWLPGAAIAVRAKVEGSAFRAVLDQGIKPHTSLASIRAKGVSFATYAADEEQGALLEFETRDGHEYWIGLTNFHVITRYNHSRLYALAVFQLAQRIRERYEAG